MEKGSLIAKSPVTEGQKLIILDEYGQSAI